MAKGAQRRSSMGAPFRTPSLAEPGRSFAPLVWLPKAGRICVLLDVLYQSIS